MKKLRIVLITAALIGYTAFFASCASLGKSKPWPTQSYADVCSPPFDMPMEPICLDLAERHGGFEYRDQFSACRTDVENYITALQAWYSCVMQDLEERYSIFLDQTKETLSCLKQKVPDRYSPGLVVDCPPIEIRIDRYYNLMTSHELPICISTPRFFPKSSFDLEDCANSVENYIQNMRDNIDTGSGYLVGKIQMAGDDAQRKFNCFARQDTLCY